MASIDSQRSDSLGARASNAGDQFQELWALQQALGLLNPSTGLSAVTVEGVASEIDAKDAGVWDGVDCALYYEGETLETASSVVIAQLKYSTTAPNADWTIARLSHNSKKKGGNNSVLRRLAEAFRAAKSRMKADSQLRIRLVSNQGVASEVFDTISTIDNGPSAPADAKLTASVNKLKLAIGLSDPNLSAFLKSLDLSERGTSSRYSLRGSITKHVADILGEDESATVRELLFSVRELMMPGKSREFISRETILGWFGVAAESGLFPAPSDFKTVAHPIDREPTRALLAAIRDGSKVVCVHGSAGCGKTTTLMQLKSLLPASSVLSLFDCYGGGRYLFTTDRRHLPEHAFTQIANELSLDLGIPFLLARGSKSPIFVKRFLEKIKLAADLLNKTDPDAILVVGIDAADNSVTAADRPIPHEPCFVTELAQADLAVLPANVRLVFSARTARKDNLKLPSTALYLPCPAFNLDETEAFAKRSLPNISSEWISQFHALSRGVPRVQDYAIRVGNSDPLATLNALRPGGKDLTDVLRKLFQEATQKSGNDTSYALIMSCLAALPAPIPPSHLASICGLQVSEIEDFVQDTQPSLRLEDEGISIADEDVEDFIRTEGTQELQQARQRTCDYFRPIHTSDTYAAVNYADLLAAAGRATEILPIIEKNLSPAAIADPIIRREVQLRRLRLAHAACRAAGNSAATMQVVLLGAEAAKDEAFLAEILDKHPDLSIRFARSSLVRLVLSDADNAKKQARVLVQDAVRAARAGNKIQARDQLHYYDEWLSRRRKAPKDERDGWRIEIDDIVANVEAVALLDGLEEAYLELTRWKSRQLHLSVALRLVPRLIAQGNANIVEKAIRDCLLPSAWEVLFFVPLALSGMKIEVSRLEKSLMALRRALVPALKGIRHADFSDRWDPQLRELLITACEIGFSLGVSEAAVRKALNLVVDLDGPFEKHYSSFEPDILDILARAWLLRRLLDNRSHTADEFLDFIDPPPPPKEEVTPKEKASKASERNSPRGDRLEDEQKRMVRTVLPVYASRIPFLDHHRKSGKIGQDQINGLGGFGSDDYLLRRYDGIGIRARTAASVLNLMHLNGGSWEALFAKASGLASPGYSDPFGRHLLPLWRFLLLRLDSRDFVLRSLVERTPALRTVREPATDKVDAAVEFSRLALIFSEPDARTFFEDAISLAQEIDREAMNQIGVLEALSTHFASWHEHARKTAAPALANVLTDIAQRLRNQEYFPWSKCINSLVRLHPPTALAALSRWSDQGIQDHAGSMPIVERYGYYLEWNAVLCVVGEVMHKYPLWKPEDNWGTFAYWFSKMLLSKPPIWLADLRDPKPLEDPFWISGTQDDNRWVDRVSRQDFFAALFTDSGADRSVVNVDGFWSSAFPTREVRTTISSALVNPQTASALARSLSTREHKWPYHLPNADQDDRYDAQFHDMPYELSGWLIDAHNDEGIDIKDTLRNGIKGPAKSPADSVLSKLGLQANPLPEKTWKRASSDKVVLKEVVWSDLPERFDHNGSSYRQRETKSEGSLLQIDADVLMSYLKMEQMDLIVGIHFERRLEKAYGGSYDESTKIKGFEEFFIFRADGTIEDYQGIVGTWRRAH